MLAMARAMSVLCAQIGCVLTRCSDTLEKLSGSEMDGVTGGAKRGAGERRRAERRSTDRAGAADTTQPSPFDVLGLPLGAWGGAGQPSATADRRRLANAGPDDDALSRVLRSYAAARAAIAVALVLGHAAVSMAGVRPPLLLVFVILAYAVQAIVYWLLPGQRHVVRRRGRLHRRDWLATIGVDVLAFGSLQGLESTGSFNFAALLVLPVLMAGALTKRLSALATASAVAMLLLALAWSAAVDGDSALPIARAGLAGIGLFAITLLSGELAARLVREESAARGSLELARQQAQLNRLVIQEMADGVLVVDAALHVRAANPAARALLVAQGLGPAAPFDLGGRPGWEPLAREVTQALAEGRWPEAGRDLTLAFEQGHSRTLRLRVRFTRGGTLDDGAAATEPLCVLLIEDVRTAFARLRQEKLAAMGRMSAGIAHEIRNPLAAISQANALLLEDALEPAQLRLARIVGANVERLQRIVDDVMEVAPGALPMPQAVDAAALVAAATDEWARTAGIVIGAEGLLRVEIPPPPLAVSFDPEHLRRVLVNLLENARRHASESRGAFFLRLSTRGADAVVLSVLSDGAPITAEVEQHLFEPFFSTRSRGSGLGLYICRELCERYGASIEYRPRPSAERLRNEFLVVMRRATLATANNA